jgi:uncharacterized protein (TIGR03435 family)
MMRGKITARRQNVSVLVDALTTALNVPVFDETGLTAAANWELEYVPGNAGALRQNVREKLGLELVPARRSVRTLVIEPASP